MAARERVRGHGSIGGSFYSDNIEDYYFTPWDLGYGPFVKFDHDFIGREALEAMADRSPASEGDARLDDDDVTRAIGTMFQKGEPAKFIDLPLCRLLDAAVRQASTKDGETVGVSTWFGYSSNERSMLSLGVVDNEVAEPGTEVTFVWGEEGGGSRKPIVERHVQTEIRAIVTPVPYVEVVRASYRPT